MEEVGVARLRGNLRAFLRKVRDGQEITITARGRAVARLCPPDDLRKRARRTLADLRKAAKVGDVISPIKADWKAQR